MANEFITEKQFKVEVLGILDEKTSKLSDSDKQKMYSWASDWLGVNLLKYMKKDI